MPNQTLVPRILFPKSPAKQLSEFNFVILLKLCGHIFVGSGKVSFVRSDQTCRRQELSYASNHEEYNQYGREIAVVMINKSMGFEIDDSAIQLAKLETLDM